MTINWAYESLQCHIYWPMYAPACHGSNNDKNTKTSLIVITVLYTPLMGQTMVT